MKSRVFTIRISPNDEEYIIAAIDMMQGVRALGSRDVSKSELIMILMNFGMKEFDKVYGNPLDLKKKQAKKRS